LLPLHQLPLDHHLRRYTGVIGPRLPQHVLAAHALEAAQHVLQRVIERMAHMQGTGDVRGRDDDRIGARTGALGPAGAKGARLFPCPVNAALDLRGQIGLIDHCGFA